MNGSDAVLREATRSYIKRSTYSEESSNLCSRWTKPKRDLDDAFLDDAFTV